MLEKENSENKLLQKSLGNLNNLFASSMNQREKGS